jgi:hypothetical protein
MRARASKLWDARAWALLGLGFLAFGLRFWRARSAAWYWDEGYLTEWSMDLAAGQRGHAGALWQNGLLPLTTSLLAPLSAAPFVRFFPGEALLAVRLWAAVLSALSALLLGLIGRRLERPGAGLLAALFFAAGPLPVALGALGIYHHLACALALAAYWLWLAQAREGWRYWAPFALAGLALASCYWMFWLPLGLLLASARERRAPWRWALLVLPVALAAAWTFAQGASYAWSAAGVLGAYHGSLIPAVAVLRASVKSFPLAWAGLGALALLPAGKRWPAWAFVGLLDAVRQRGDLSASPYVLAPLVPWACLGLALLIQRCWERNRVIGAAALAFGVLAAGIGSFEWIQRQSVPPDQGHDLLAYLQAHAKPEDTVIALPPVNWLLRGAVRPVELSQSAAADGFRAGFVPAKTPPALFAYDPSLEKARYLVVSRAHFDGLFLDPSQAYCAFRAELEGWPLVQQDAWFKLYANPRFGARKDLAVRLLHDPVFYRKAAEGAVQRGRADLEALALARAQAGYQR